MARGYRVKKIFLFNIIGESGPARELRVSGLPSGQVDSGQSLGPAGPASLEIKQRFDPCRPSTPRTILVNLVYRRFGADPRTVPVRQRNIERDITVFCIYSAWSLWEWYFSVNSSLSTTVSATMSVEPARIIDRRVEAHLRRFGPYIVSDGAFFWRSPRRARKTPPTSPISWASTAPPRFACLAGPRERGADRGVRGWAATTGAPPRSG